MKKKLGYNIRIKSEKVDHSVFKEYVEIAKRADDAGIYYLAFPEFFARPDPNRIHVVPYMAAIATQTENVKLGFDVLELPLLHPLQVAYISASLDIISNGRFILGIGLGWVKSEYENFGIPFEERGKIGDESLDIIKKLLSEGAIHEYKGKYFKLKNVVNPQCVQKPHPPIWIGGHSNPALRRTAQYGNEWAGMWQDPGKMMGWKKEEWDITERLEKLKQYCREFGRELVFGREPRGSCEVGYNQRLEVNINPDKEKAIEEMRYWWEEVRKRQCRGGDTIENKLKYAAVGPADEVIEKIEAVFKTGAYLVTLYPSSVDSKTQWERIENEILPCI